MIFQKTPAKPTEYLPTNVPDEGSVKDEVETVVGPSVNVEGDFGSEGNIVVKGTVSGSVRTSKHLSVEVGAKILANVKAGTAKIAGEVRGNMKIKEVLELTSTARVLGDVEVKTLIIEAGAIISGRISMPGLEGAEVKMNRPIKIASKKYNEEAPAVTL